MNINWGYCDEQGWIWENVLSPTSPPFLPTSPVEISSIKIQILDTIKIQFFKPLTANGGFFLNVVILGIPMARDLLER